jgi:hypothetical protein
MGEIVNLNRVRKAKAKAEAAAKAAANRASHGRSKAEKAADRAEVTRLGRLLDGARRDEPEK